MSEKSSVIYFVSVPCSIDDLSVTKTREKLKKTGVKTRLKNREKLLDFLKRE